MSNDLDKLHDIIVPEPVSFWPSTEGWLILLALLISIVIPLLMMAMQNYQAARYRREALSELQRIRLAGNNNQQQMQQLLNLLKRTALSAYPREQVAQLTGQAWWDFLSQHSGVDFSHSSLQNDIYNPEFMPSKESTEMLFSLVNRWIRQHKRANNDIF